MDRVISNRSYVQISKNDLKLLGKLAEYDREDFFRRYPERGIYYKNNILCVVLCQGASLHYIDGRNGIKDFDVWTFYKKDPAVKQFPPRRLISVDFGPSKFGKQGQDSRYLGRKVDLLGRSIEWEKGEKYDFSLKRYFISKSTKSAQLLAKKASIVIEPYQDIGKIIWP
ncbi:hypothetical protein E3V36_03675 [Candidatus Marinimicrobia bacterium MT.SAG.2]|nr:hypothetical protein E3V36_03675 [Candidatus Marinimicrobia bacterium MT.SAG.2]